MIYIIECFKMSRIFRSQYHANLVATNKCIKVINAINSCEIVMLARQKTVVQSVIMQGVLDCFYSCLNDIQTGITKLQPHFFRKSVWVS